MHNIFSAFEKKYAAASTASRQPSDKLPVSNTLNYKRASTNTQTQCAGAALFGCACACGAANFEFEQDICEQSDRSWIICYCVFIIGISLVKLHAIRACVHRVDVIFDHAFNPSSPLFCYSMRLY